MIQTYAQTARDAGLPMIDAAPGPTSSCVGALANFTRASLEAATHPTSGCGDGFDLDLVCHNDLMLGARYCACLEELKDSEPTRFTRCVDICLTHNLPLSRSCLSCYSSFAHCSLNNCLGECRNVREQNSDRCRRCEMAAGCYTAFDRCSGLGTGHPAPDAGADAAADAPAALAAQ
jgi:hypothetical protein